MIDKEKVIKALECCDHRETIAIPNYALNILIFRLQTLLKEQPEIVRCKDCRYYHGINEGCGARSFYPPSGDWFCADGER